MNNWRIDTGENKEILSFGDFFHYPDLHWQICLLDHYFAIINTFWCKVMLAAIRYCLARSALAEYNIYQCENTCIGLTRQDVKFTHSFVPAISLFSLFSFLSFMPRLSHPRASNSYSVCLILVSSLIHGQYVWREGRECSICWRRKKEREKRWKMRREG